MTRSLQENDFICWTVNAIESLDNVSFPSDLQQLTFGKIFHQRQDNVSFSNVLQQLTRRWPPTSDADYSCMCVRVCFVVRHLYICCLLMSLFHFFSLLSTFFV